MLDRDEAVILLGEEFVKAQKSWENNITFH